MRGDSATGRGRSGSRAENAREGLRQLIENGDPQSVAIINGAMAAVSMKRQPPGTGQAKRLTKRLDRMDAEEVVHVYLVHQRLAARGPDALRA